MSFKRFDPEDIVISAESIVTSAWTGNAPSLTTFFTSSEQDNSNSGNYFLEVYQDSYSSASAEIQFSIAYCDKKGSGSLYLNPGVPGVTPSSVNYGTYRSIVLGDEEQDFRFSNVTSPYFYALNVDRARFKEKIKPENFELKLVSGSDSLTLTPILGQVETYLDAGRVYELKGTGSAGLLTLDSTLFTQSGSYGKLLPDIGVVLLNGQTLDTSIAGGGINLGTQRVSNTDAKNNRKLFKLLNEFKVQSQETLSSNFIFVRVRNSEYNYSSNPSYITGSGDLRFTELIDDPKSYFTSVGLYNDNNDLLAVAKLSRPLLKDSRKEALIRIKLDF
jgi:hypothetical protein